jgi:hypothetical protein
MKPISMHLLLIEEGFPTISRREWQEAPWFGGSQHDKQK